SEYARIAAFLHLRKHGRADRRGVRDRGTGNPAQERRGDDIDHRQPASNAEKADQHIGKRDQPPRHPPFGHDRPGQHEKRDREHRHLAHSVRDLEHHRLERNVDPKGAGDRRQSQRVGDRYADREAAEESENDYEKFHLGSFPAQWSAASAACDGCPMITRSMTKSSVMTPPIGIGRYVTPTERNGKASIVFSQVASTSRLPQITMNTARVATNASLTSTTSRCGILGSMRTSTATLMCAP